MNHRIRFNRVLGLALLLTLGWSAVPAWAQGAVPGGDIIRIRKMTPVKEKTPIYQTSMRTQSAARQTDWWRAVVEYETAPDWIDALEFTFYAYLEDQSAKNAPVMFRGLVTYANVPKGRHLADIFLHPNVVARMGVVKQIAVVVKHKGVVVATESTSKEPNWWETRFSPVDGVLLNRAQTPFALVDYDSYNFIQPAAPVR